MVTEEMQPSVTDEFALLDKESFPEKPHLCLCMSPLGELGGQLLWEESLLSPPRNVSRTWNPHAGPSPQLLRSACGPLEWCGWGEWAGLGGGILDSFASMRLLDFKNKRQRRDYFTCYA